MTSTPYVQSKPGGNITLICRAFGIVPDPALNLVRWIFKGTLLHETERSKISEQFVRDTAVFKLSLAKVRVEDEGVYACNVYSSGRRMTRIHMNLTVNGKLLLTEKLFVLEYPARGRRQSYS